MPFSGESRPAKSTSDGSALGAISAGTSTPLGTKRASRAPRCRAARASACETPMTTVALRTMRRATAGACRASSTSVPCSVRTTGLPANAAGNPVGSQWAWTTSAFRAARLAARVIEVRSGGTAQGRRRTFRDIPSP